MENNKIAFASSSLQLDVDYLSVLIMNISFLVCNR